MAAPGVAAATQQLVVTGEGERAVEEGERAAAGVGTGVGEVSVVEGGEGAGVGVEAGAGVLSVLFGVPAGGHDGKVEHLSGPLS